MKPKQSLANKVRFFTAEDFITGFKPGDRFDSLAVIRDMVVKEANAKLEREGKVVLRHPTDYLEWDWIEVEQIQVKSFRDECTHRAIVINQEPIK